jgi:hypothetical protein
MASLPPTTYVRPDKAIRENIIVKMEEDRDAVQDAFQQALHIEHDVDFSDHLIPGPPEIRSRVALCNLTPAGGAAVATNLAGPGATVDVQVGAVSLLAAPAPLGPPGVPTPLVFLPGTLIPAGTRIDYVLTDNGVICSQVCCNVQWVKDLSHPWMP